MWCVIVIFPDHTHLLQRSRCFVIVCVIIYLDSGVHDYVLTKTESGGKFVSKIHLSDLLAEAVVHSKVACSMFVYAFGFDPAFLINLYEPLFWFGIIFSTEESCWFYFYCVFCFMFVVFVFELLLGVL